MQTRTAAEQVRHTRLHQEFGPSNGEGTTVEMEIAPSATNWSRAQTALSLGLTALVLSIAAAGGLGVLNGNSEITRAPEDVISGSAISVSAESLKSFSVINGTSLVIYLVSTRVQADRVWAMEDDLASGLPVIDVLVEEEMDTFGKALLEVHARDEVRARNGFPPALIIDLRGLSSLADKPAEAP